MSTVVVVQSIQNKTTIETIHILCGILLHFQSKVSMVLKVGQLVTGHLTLPGTES